MPDAPDVDLDALSTAYEDGLRLEKLGRLDEAAERFRQALALDPADRGGASIRLAALGRGAAPDRAPPSYVAMLFNQNAAAFDDVLVGQLQYRTPEDIAEALPADRPLGRLLDLGCGTGLIGAALRGRYDHLTGVDLAEEMLAQADARALYDELFIADIAPFLEAAQAEAESWDTIVLADVLPYLGDLRGVLAACRDRLRPGGVAAFSFEADPDPDRAWRVGPGARFTHGARRTAALAAEAGFSVRQNRAITVRLENADPVSGRLFVCTA